jgi:hypothetical protein
MFQEFNIGDILILMDLHAYMFAFDTVTYRDLRD